MSDRPTGKALFFKIPHHGSITAHHPRVWTEMLVPNATSIVTPWNRGGGLLTKADVNRIADLTRAGFSTSIDDRRRPRRRSAVVEKQIRETVGKIAPSQAGVGHIRVRNAGGGRDDVWCIELSESAGGLYSKAA